MRYPQHPNPPIYRTHPRTLTSLLYDGLVHVVRTYVSQIERKDNHEGVAKLKRSELMLRSPPKPSPHPCGHQSMKFSTAFLASCMVAARSVRAFTLQSSRLVYSRAFIPKRRTMTTTTALNANVLKLTSPSDLLSDVDIFIFDCDGVIWRVRAVISLLAIQWPVLIRREILLLLYRAIP